MHWNKVAIIGVGLIGGSVGLALRRRGLAREVVGVGRRRPSLAQAMKLGAVSRVTTDLADGAQDADLVVVCTPVDDVVAHVLAAASAGREGMLITDAASTKAGIVRAVQRGLPAAHRGRFVGSHPIAGGENPERRRHATICSTSDWS
jgi:prephenate dehydrogenase